MPDTAAEYYPDDLDLEAPLSESSAEVYVGRTAFKTGPPTQVGVELEWLVYDTDAPSAPVPAQRVQAALAGLAPACDAADSGPRPAHPPGLGGRLTTEPGGQLELSSPPAPLAQCLRDTTADLAVLRQRLAAARLSLVGYGLDPLRPAVRQTDEPRYVAMERHFDRRGRAGRLMMCSTASVQVCLDAGADDADVAVRWRSMYALAPVLVALFANSPLLEAHPTGWRCSRQAVWSRIDPTRTRSPADVDPLRPAAKTDDPRAAYARYALDAEVLAVRRPDRPWSAPAGLTFRAWLRGESPAELGRPRVDDLDYHLSTLFPPVRPRGHLELRVIDAQSGDRWRLVAAVVATLLDDPVARDEALAAIEPVAPTLPTAARVGLADPAIGRAALGVLTAALAGIRRAGLPAELADATDGFAERFTARGRSPADDLLAGWPDHPLRPANLNGQAPSAGPPRRWPSGRADGREPSSSTSPARPAGNGAAGGGADHTDRHVLRRWPIAEAAWERSL